MSHLISALQRQAREHPQATALSDGENHWSWQTLHSEVINLAGHIANAQGALALFMENGPAWAISDLAAIHADRTCLPLPGFFSDAQLRHALADASVQQVLTDNPRRLQQLADVRANQELRIAGQPIQLLQLKPKERRHFPDIAKITYTSGTTGAPKGVPLSLERMETTALALMQAVEAGRDDRALALLPLAILLENIGSIHVPLLAGATLLTPSAATLGWSGSGALDAERLTSALRRLRPTTAILTPELLKLFLQLQQQKALPDSFRFLAVGGAPASEAHLKQAQALGLPVYQGYGLSEAASVVTLNTPRANRPGSVGRPLPGYEIRIADEGEVMIKGSGFGGYLHQSADAHPWLATGDLGRLDEEGFLYVQGRKRQVIINSFGRNVSPEWVQAEMLGEPAIAQIAVFGNDRPWLSAVATPAPGATGQDLKQAIERVNQHLPDYARIRDFIVVDGFSRARDELTANGRPRHEIIYKHYQSQLEALYEPVH